ncbi:MAG: hypothetical protein R3E66_03365 [bacterium]
MEKLRLVHDSEVDAELKMPGVTVHRYVLNMPGLYLFVGLAIACYLGCGVLWFGAMMSGIAGKAGFAVALALGIVLSLTVSYWKGFGEKRFVAVSPTHLMIGEDSTRMWMVGWELLDAQKLGLTDMAVSRAQGRMRIEVAGQIIPLTLYSPFAYLEDPQGFMFHVLTALEQPREENADA